MSSSDTKEGFGTRDKYCKTIPLGCASTLFDQESHHKCDNSFPALNSSASPMRQTSKEGTGCSRIQRRCVEDQDTDDPQEDNTSEQQNDKPPSPSPTPGIPKGGGGGEGGGGGGGRRMRKKIMNDRKKRSTRKLMKNWRLKVVVEGRSTRVLEVKVVELENGRLQREERRGRNEIIIRRNKKREGEGI